MNFLTPLAFALAALLPIIIALYFLKLRREEQRISSTYLWRTLVRDTAANAPWQRLKPSWLLLLQLLFLSALILALARPFTWSEAAAGSHLILVIDTSASMGATDIKPNRLTEAIATARRLIEGLPSSTRVTVIEAGAQVRVPVSSADDHNAAIGALAALQPGLAGADVISALTMAAAIAAREPDSEVVIVSDGRVTLPENFTLPGRVRYISIGQDNDNQALGAFSLQFEAGGRSLTAFIQIVNYGTRDVQRRLAVYAAGQLLTARDLALAPGKAQVLTLPGLPGDARAWEARLDGQDVLAADDRAWAVPPPTGKVAIRIVGPGNRFLETALRLRPNAEITLVQPDLAEPDTNTQPIGSATNQAVASLTIFDSVIPTGTLPSGNLLFIAPPRSTEVFSVTGRIDQPVLAAVVPDDPVLQYVDLREVAVQDATRVSQPAWARAVIVDGRTNAPLLLIGEQDGRRLAVLAFDLRRSDLPLRVAFPILMANLIDTLVPGGVAGVPANVEPGRPLSVAAPPQANMINVRTPDGQAHTLTSANGSVVFDQTDQLGVYEIATQDTAGQSQDLGRFTVNLFNPGESDVRPRATLPIAAAGAANIQELPHARDEWWRPIAWIALVLLVAEWLLVCRGNLVRLWSWVTVHGKPFGMKRKA
ncbi:MAG TPA: BatA and WFA domain-containing protein [Anaerolineae bacterium]|nr:BatA and WFA domain-containing protein [Anaerolineae bacterium]